MKNVEQVRKLATILMDPTATIAEKDDAAIELGEFDDSEAVAALITATQSKDIAEIVLASIGESIAQIWIRLDNFDPTLFNQLPREAQREAQSFILAKRPEWQIKEPEQKTKMTVKVASTRNQENLVAQLWYENEQWGEISQKLGELELEIYPKSNGHSWNLRYEEVVKIIQEAKEKLPVPDRANSSNSVYYEHTVAA